MDPEEILQRVAALKIASEGKTNSITISTTEADRGVKRAEKLVLGKIFGRRQLNRDTLKDKLPEIFQLRGSCEVEIVGINLFVIALDLDTDRDRIITEGPWHWFNDLMLVKKVESMRTAANTEFDEISMWIQLHNLPIMCMEPQILRRMGEKIGRVLEIDEGSRGLCLGRYARIRITRALDEPLVQGIPIRTEGVEGETMVLVLYEKLPDLFCYACGKIGHLMKDCSGSEKEKTNPGFGAWLKAGRGVDYRRVTHNPKARAAQPNPRGPRPPPRGSPNSMERQEGLALQVVETGNKRVDAVGGSEERVSQDTLLEMGGGDMVIDEREGEGGAGWEKEKESESDIGDDTRMLVREVGEREEVDSGLREETERVERKEVGELGRENGKNVVGEMDNGAQEKESSFSEIGSKSLKLRKTLPKKMKTNPTGKGWKRMARANLLDNIIGSPTKRQDKGGVLGKMRDEGGGGRG